MSRNANKEFEYLMDHYLLYHIDDLIDNVLDDSEEDPHYSAVTANNLIKCYVKVCSEWGMEPPFSNAETYFTWTNRSEAEYRLFEEKRTKEQTYYIGEIF